MQCSRCQQSLLIGLETDFFEQPSGALLCKICRAVPNDMSNELHAEFEFVTLSFAIL